LAEVQALKAEWEAAGYAVEMVEGKWPRDWNVRRAVITPEGAFLKRRFGVANTDYKMRVRRWL
jgi:hypothetical protein